MTVPLAYPSGLLPSAHSAEVLSPAAAWLLVGIALIIACATLWVLSAPRRHFPALRPGPRPSHRTRRGGAVRRPAHAPSPLRHRQALAQGHR